MNRLPRILFGVLVVALLLALAMPVIAAETKGKIKSVTPDKNEFVLTDSNNKDWTMKANADCKVFINDKESKIGDLQRDDEAMVTYEKVGDDLRVSQIRVTRK